MNRRTFTVMVFMLGMAFGIFVVSQLAFRDGNNANGHKTSNNEAALVTYRPPALPATIDFAGEPVPLNRLQVREMFDRELIYNYYSPGHLIYLIKLSHRFFPVIDSILKAEGMPEDFKYLCVAESNLQPLTSRVGAQGYWQFMKDTAPAYNLEVTSTVDERNHLEKSTVAACKYLKQAYNKFGTWTAAAASYNCGMGGYNSRATYQGTRYYYDLQLPTETNKYIFRILTFKHILSNPQALGFMVDKSEAYLPRDVRTVQVSSSIANLSDWARAQGSNFKTLLWYNPWINSKSLVVGKGKTYQVKLPLEQQND